MSFAVTVKDAQDLRRLIPLNILSASRFEELCADAAIEEVARGAALFEQGDTRNEFVYVLTGTVSLQAGGMEMETITGGTESARFALAHQIPRKVSAIAKGRVRYIRVDAAYVNQPAEQMSGTVATYEVSDIPDDAADDWVATLLKSPIFQRLPPANLQNILSILEEVPVRAGQEIVRQDEPGDYYYVIKRGRCALTRKPSRVAREIKLAELKTCDTFGEDSLISDQPRNVTVTMMTDGTLLRLSKANFLKLVKEPVISFVNMDVAQIMIPQGARWLDVRAPDSFEDGHLPGALNVPFFKLRMELPNLSRQLKYILVCETGKVSEAAAFLLIRHEFDAFVLKGGVSGVFKDQLVSEGGQSAADFEPEGEMVVVRPRPPEGAVALAVESHSELSSEVPFDINLPKHDVRDGGAVEEIQLFRKELTGLKERLDQLQRESESSAEVENELKSSMEVADGRIEEALQRLQSTTSDLARLEEAGRSQLSVTQQLDDLRTRLADADAAKNELVERMRAELRKVIARRETREAILRNAVLEVKAARESVEQDLVNAKTENDDLRAQLRQLLEAHAPADISAPVQQHVADSGAVATGADWERERAQVLARNRDLERQLAELTALVDGRVDQRGTAEEGGEAVGALKTELEAVRMQAERDVVAVQEKLRDAEEDSAKLRSALEVAQQRLLLIEADTSKVPASGKHRHTLPGLAWVVSMISMLILGAVVVIVLFAGTDIGHEWIRSLLMP